MIRGTTPTLCFTLPVDGSLIDKLYITVVQGKETVLEKTKENCEIDGAVVTCTLTQADTLRLDAEKTAELQVRLLTVNSEALASHVFRMTVSRILKDGEI